MPANGTAEPPTRGRRFSVTLKCGSSRHLSCHQTSEQTETWRFDMQCATVSLRAGSKFRSLSFLKGSHTSAVRDRRLFVAFQLSGDGSLHVALATRSGRRETAAFGAERRRCHAVSRRPLCEAWTAERSDSKSSFAAAVRGSSVGKERTGCWWSSLVFCPDMRTRIESRTQRREQ